MKASKTKAVVHWQKVPFFSGVLELVTAGIVPGGTKSNFEYTSPFVEYPEELSNALKMMLNDAQTSGGLLISLPAAAEQGFIRELNNKGIMTAASIGEVAESQRPQIKIL